MGWIRLSELRITHNIALPLLVRFEGSVPTHILSQQNMGSIFSEILLIQITEFFFRVCFCAGILVGLSLSWTADFQRS